MTLHAYCGIFDHDENHGKVGDELEWVEFCFGMGDSVRLSGEDLERES